MLQFFKKKYSFAERRTTVCYSNYKAVDCKLFFGSSTGRVAKNRAVLNSIGLAETVGLLLLLLRQGKSQEFFLKVGEGRKFSSFFLDN